MKYQKELCAFFGDMAQQFGIPHNRILFVHYRRWYQTGNAWRPWYLKKSLELRTANPAVGRKWWKTA